jgi:hypothetical protein
VLEFDEPDTLLKLDFEVTNETSPLRILQKFLTDEVMEEVVVESNRYKSQVFTANKKSFPHWFEITLAELWQFLAISLMMGLIKKPSVPDYWTTKHLFGTPSFSEIMSRNR